jgi:hypothetical protein
MKVGDKIYDKKGYEYTIHKSNEVGWFYLIKSTGWSATVNNKIFEYFYTEKQYKRLKKLKKLNESR